MATRLFILGLLSWALAGCMVWDTGPDRPFVVDRETPPQRLNSRSPWYSLKEEEVHLYTNYCGWDEAKQQRVTHLEIGEKVLSMVKEADELIVATWFLFDDLYADEPAGDYATELADMMIAKKKENPSIRIVLILDLMHKSWGSRQSVITQRLVDAGVDIFYSDLLETRAAQRKSPWEKLHMIGRSADLATGGLAAIPWDLAMQIPLPYVYDGDLATMAIVGNGSLFKANHRKAIVTKRGGVYEGLTTSWNPHNPSLLHENHAISVTGPLACYMYEIMREDARQSVELERNFVERRVPRGEERMAYLEAKFPSLPETAWRGPADDGTRLAYVPAKLSAPGVARPVPSAGGAVDKDLTEPQACVATEECVEPILMEWLRDVEAGDRVRIQMFYLSRVAVVNAILDAAARTQHPIEILLDPNRVGINYAKDGTPNAQVAAYLMERAQIENARIEIRWYDTHGEQNHAKAMTITNEDAGKYQMLLGSSNWTRKNLGGINLENDVFVRNAPALNGQFNAVFDKLWAGEENGVRYSVAWDDPRYNYQKSSGRNHWAIPRREGLKPIYDAKGRPELLEQELVHW